MQDCESGKSYNATDFCCHQTNMYEYIDKFPEISSHYDVSSKEYKDISYLDPIQQGIPKIVVFFKPNLPILLIMMMIYLY